MRVSLCLWAGSIASSCGLSGAVEAGVSLNRVGVLIEQGSGSSVALRSLLSRLSVRPTVDLKAIYSDLEEKLAKDVEERIKKDHTDTQSAIVSRVSALSAKSKEVDNLKTKADEINIKWNDCTGVEIEITKKLESLNSKLPGSEKNKDTSCDAQEDAEDVSISGSTIKYAARMNDPTEYSNRLTQLEQFVVNKYYKQVADQVKKKVQDYEVKQNKCQKATSEYNTLLLQKYKTGDELMGQRHTCQNLKSQSNTVMCNFGGKLQDKCVRLSEYQQLVDDIGAKNGGEFSHPDRMEEWRVTQIAKCLVKKLADNSEVNDDTLKECESLVNFERDVGALDKKGDEVDDLVSAFTCTETKIEFLGGTYISDTWSWPKKASDFKRVDIAAYAVNLIDGTDPFSFCR